MQIVDWWYGIVDSWFGVTVTIGIIAMIGGALYSIVKTIMQRGSDDTPPTKQ